MTNTRGFSLVELSIVLIIIGLLVGGVTGGSKLIHNAKIHKAVTKIENLKQGVKTFELTYDSLPGDMTDATDFFGTSGITNGNGDGNVTGGEEKVRWYAHMKAAEILSSGKTDKDGRPLLGLTDEVYGIDLVYDSMWGKYPARHVFRIMDYNAATIKMSSSVLYSIDKKLDDSMPYSGAILANGVSGTCKAANTTCCTNNLSMNNTSFNANTLKSAKYNLQVKNHCDRFFVDIL